MSKTKSWALIALIVMGYFAVLSAPLLADESDLPEILHPGSDIYLPDFSYAGYGFGVESIPEDLGKILDITDFGAVANDGKDDSEALLAAIDKANDYSGQVTIQFPVGQFMIADIIPITRSELRIQGMGRSENGTTLYFPRPLKMMDDGGKLDELREYLIRYNKRQRVPRLNLDVYFSEYSWSGGFFWVGEKDLRSSAYLEELDTAVPAIAHADQGQRGGFEVRVDNAAELKVGEWVQLLWYNRQG